MTIGRFAIVFFLAALVSGLLYRTATWATALPCHQLRKAGSFMADCNTSQFGDYEHGAYYYNLEPEAVKSLLAAKVIIVGNSRVQFGFSTEAVSRYFGARSIPHYLLGFGYDDRVDFAQGLVARYKLKPKVLVINSDPFFSHGSIAAVMIAPMTLQTLFPKVGSVVEYTEKHMFNLAQPTVCNYISSLCGPPLGSVYRDARTGAWDWSGLWTAAQQGNVPVGGEALRRLAPPNEEDIRIAADFIASVGIPHECVILTALPNGEIDADGFTRKLGQRLGVPVALTKAVNLTTVDGSHLTGPSAERWSARFLEEIDPVIKKCVSGIPR